MDFNITTDPGNCNPSPAAPLILGPLQVHTGVSVSTVHPQSSSSPFLHFPSFSPDSFSVLFPRFKSTSIPTSPLCSVLQRIPPASLRSLALRGQSKTDVAPRALVINKSLWARSFCCPSGRHPVIPLISDIGKLGTHSPPQQIHLIRDLPMAVPLCTVRLLSLANYLTPS